MLAHDAQERLAIALVAGERTAVIAGDTGALGVGFTVHQRGDGGGVVAAFVGVVRQPA